VSKLTTTELAAKLYALQRALEDATTAREILAEADATIKRIRDEVGTDYSLLKVLFSPDQPMSLVRHQHKRGYHRVDRAIWFEVTMQKLKEAGRPITAAQLAPMLKGTPGEAITTSVLASRLTRLAREHKVTRILNEQSRLGIRWSATVPVSPNQPIIQRHRGQVDSVSTDPHPWQMANRAAARQQ
jgi:hypothetical protein